MTGFSHPARLRRSVLSVPAINQRALEKASSLACDAIIFDLEDSVAPERKAEARDNLRRLFATENFGSRERIIRINGLQTAEAHEDMALVLSCWPDAVLIPKVNTPHDVQLAGEMLDEADAAETLRIWAMIETPKAILNAAAIAEYGRTAGARLDCFVVGLNDLRKDTGVPAEPGRTYLVPWLMQVVLAARAFGLDVIDSVSNDFKDLTAFEAECGQGRAMGFDGKMLIHPAQIEGANRQFGFSDEAIAEARMVISAFSAPGASDLNVINVNGRMIERLHLEQAERLMAKASLADQNRKDQP
ncbi:CoA ester lyase [Rhizobium sp. RU36D]|uniref:HpcH/HpaI aldolase/citrate lyase family protein n=1 Tax=Rhizobium sp. RU36D TaxID=1907415 RepID=UPI0009FC572C|nr:CoA ester lyase [Rhizobium sp. RU36D]